MPSKVRVLVVDDSAFMRKIVSDLLASEPGVEVVGVARDGFEALDKVKELAPDVVTLDIEMPRMDGLTALGRIMAERPTRVIMCSSLTQRGAQATIKALSLGAIDFIPKPIAGVFSDLVNFKRDLISKVFTAMRSRFPRQAGAVPYAPRRALKSAGSAEEPARPADTVVVIGSSTGGPSALQEVFRNLPAGLKAGVLVVQHMPPGFTRSLACRLDDVSPLAVAEAAGGEQVSDGRALLAPGGFHMVPESSGRIVLTTDPPRHGVRPAVDITMEAAAELYGPNVIGVVLTGMGFDGARGCGSIKARGGIVIAEHESSCVVYGMPRAVVEMGYADKVCPIDEIAGTIAEAVEERAGRRVRR